MILLQSFKHLFQDLELLFMGVRVDVDDNILEVPDYTLHESLDTGHPSSPIGDLT